MYSTLLYTYLGLLVVSFLIGIKRFKHKSADKYILLLLAVIFISECIAQVVRKIFKYNMPVYHLLNPVQLLITSLYFNYSLPVLQKKHLGWVIGGIGIAFSIFSAIFLQDIYSFPSVFLLFESFSIISLCMLSYFSIFRKEDFEPTKHVFFWITTSTLIFWSFTFIIWGMISTFLVDAQEFVPWTYFLLSAINYLYYGSIGVIFLNYKKLIPSGE